MIVLVDAVMFIKRKKKDAPMHQAIDKLENKKI